MALNVLIVDDSDVIRSMVARTLHLAGVPLGEVHEASNGREALSVAQEHWLDLVLADINMPVMNGADMLAEMRTRPEMVDIPVVVVSTEGATERVEELMRLGVAAWIRKPFTPEEIRDVVEVVLHSVDQRADYRGALDDSLAIVFERFAFSFPESVPAEDTPDPGDDLMVAKISFLGAATGSLTVAAPAELCAELAANALGTDVDEPNARLRGADALGEIANMTCGHIATAIDGETPTDIQAPVVSRMARTDWDRLAQSDRACAYLVEDRPVIALLGVRRREIVRSGAA